MSEHAPIWGAITEIAFKDQADGHTVIIKIQMPGGLIL